MLKFRWYFILVFFLSGRCLFSQLPGCNASAVIVDSVFLANTSTTHIDVAANWKRLLLCGPNTVVYDTLRDTLNEPIRELVFVGEHSKYVGKGINHWDANAIYVKSTATLELRPATTQNSLLFLIVEPGATILNNSGFPFYAIDTCANLIFPPGCLITGFMENETVEKETIRIWPSPVRDELHLQLTSDAAEPETEILIYNSLGQLVRQKKLVFENKTSTISLIGFENGLYFFELKNSSETLAKKRFVTSR